MDSRPKHWREWAGSKHGRGHTPKMTKEQKRKRDKAEAARIKQQREEFFIRQAIENA